MSNITTLRDALFATLAGLQDKENPMDLDRASAVCNVAREITSTAKVEIDFIRATGGNSGSGFIAVEGTSTTPTGKKTVALVPGGSITTHKLR